MGAVQVGFLLIPDFALMSYTSAVEPLRAANQLSGRELYRWWRATPDGRPAASSSGSAIAPEWRCGEEPDSADLVLVCAGGNPADFNDPATFAWLRRLAAFGVTIGGVSGGPFLLARAGLLEGRRCTIHWEHAPAFRETFPSIELSRSLFEIDGARITCSGGIAALDLMIALIARDHGRDLAHAVSEWFLHTHVREGLDPQRMDLRARWGIRDDRLLEVLKTMEGNIEQPLPRGVLASIAGTSLRQLERAFERSLGCGIHAHYMSLRLAQARQLLRESSLPLFEIALATGFNSPTQFSRAYRQAFGAPPSALRGMPAAMRPRAMSRTVNSAAHKRDHSTRQSPRLEPVAVGATN